ncbi:hypothetical protein [Ottowia oryzae]|nr:hypothetical protein [Ottowia oryzae]
MTGGSLSLSHVAHLPRIGLRAPDDTDLKIDRVADLPKIQRVPPTPESERALHERAANQTHAESADDAPSGCRQRRGRVK